MPPPHLDAERIQGLFHAVDTGLSGSGLRSPVEIVIVGGAAVALQWNRRRTTYDIDVVAEGIPPAFWAVVEAVGHAEGLDDGWLNAAARVKAPTGPTPGEPSAVYVGSNLRVYGASPHYVLAMKLLTGRGIDREDTPILMEAAQPRSKEELYTLVERAYPTAQIPASTGFIIDEMWDDYTIAHPELDRARAGAVGVHVRPFPHDNHGWEVATTEPDGSPRQLSGPHPTAEEAEAARDFLARVLNVHPQLRILGQHPPSESNEAPTVGVFSPDPDGPWYLMCQNPDGTKDATSPPYPTYQAASDTLDQLGLLSISTTDLDLGQRITVEPTSTSCRCSLKGWRCEHIEVEGPEAEPPDHSHGLSL